MCYHLAKKFFLTRRAISLKPRREREVLSVSFFLALAVEIKTIKREIFPRPYFYARFTQITGLAISSMHKREFTISLRPVVL